VEASSATLVKTDINLDYSLLLLPENLTPEYGFLQLRNTPSALDERIYIAQHPGAKGKQLGVFDDQLDGDCRITSLTEPRCGGTGVDTGYTCDTEGGSSGSPVLGSIDNCVVALHHCRGSSDCPIDPNRGVPITEIITHLGSALPSNAICTTLVDPIPDIRANDSDEPISISQSDDLVVNVTLEPGSKAGNNADWWCLAATPFGWYYYDRINDIWLPGQICTYEGPLVVLTPYEVLNTSGLPIGTYVFYFGVDMNMNCVIDLGVAYYDSIEVTITN
jgi:hypothetical protein